MSSHVHAFLMRSNYDVSKSGHVMLPKNQAMYEQKTKASQSQQLQNLTCCGPSS